jgi:hypothetical protein
MTLTSDPMEELAKIKKVIIKQSVELFEALTGCETPNRYNVFAHKDSGDWIYLFKCKEISSFCARNCIKPEARPFSLKVKHIAKQSDFNDEDYDNNTFATFVRPFKFCGQFCER